MGIFNLKEQFATYGEYHAHIVNVLVHIVCVPLILWTVLVFLSYTGPLLPAIDAHLVAVPTWMSFGMLETNLSTAIVAVFMVYYFILDFVATAIYAPVLYTMLVTATSFARTNPHAVKYAAILHIVSWIAQFIGHGVFEKRAPALLDNLVQALVMAPFFVFLEVLFFLGYRPALHAQVKAEVGLRAERFHNAKKRD